MDALGIKLDPGAAARLSGLARMLEGEGVPVEGEGEGHPRRAMPRLELRAHARVSTSKGLFEGRLRNLSAGGCAIAAEASASVGEEILVSITSPDGRFDYVFPGRVMWATRGQIGMRFSGMPTRVVSSQASHRAA
jgi:Tfp pilus assembly protein PilZ